MRISDWSSDVCSSDLNMWLCISIDCWSLTWSSAKSKTPSALPKPQMNQWPCDRNSDVQGKSVSVRVHLGGGRIIKKTISSYTLGTLLVIRVHPVLVAYTSHTYPTTQTKDGQTI